MANISAHLSTLPYPPYREDIRIADLSEDELGAYWRYLTGYTVLHEQFKQTRKETSKNVLQWHLGEWESVRGLLNEAARYLNMDLVVLVRLWFFSAASTLPEILRAQHEEVFAEVATRVQRDLESKHSVSAEMQCRVVTMMMMAVSDIVFFIMRNSEKHKSLLFTSIVFINLNWPEGVRYDIMSSVLDRNYASFAEQKEAMKNTKVLQLFGEVASARANAPIADMFSSMEKMKIV